MNETERARHPEEDGPPTTGLHPDVLHAVRNSVTVIQGVAETLRDEGGSLDHATRQRLVNLVLNHAAMIASAVDDVDLPVTHNTGVEADDTTTAEPSEPNVALAPRAQPGPVPEPGAAAMRFATCPHCGYRGLYVPPGRDVVRCRYCRATGPLEPGERGRAMADPERYAHRVVRTQGTG